MATGASPNLLSEKMLDASDLDMYPMVEMYSLPHSTFMMCDKHVLSLDEFCRCNSIVGPSVMQSVATDLIQNSYEMLNENSEVTTVQLQRKTRLKN